MVVRINWLMLSGVPQGSILGSLWNLLKTANLFSMLENILICYANDSILIAVVPSPGIRDAESSNSDFDKINAWCDLWG